VVAVVVVIVVPDTMNVVEVGNIVRDILVLLIQICVLNIVKMNLFQLVVSPVMILVYVVKVSRFNYAEENPLLKCFEQGI